MKAHLIFRSGVDRLADGQNAIAVRKISQEFAVSFAEANGSIVTREGRVPVAQGDAIITGAAGERWPITRERFAAKYQSLDQPANQATNGAGTRLQAGRYRSLPLPALARQIGMPFTVVLAGGGAVLHGAPGDWLVDYGDDSLGVVAQSRFADLYEVLGS